MGDALDSSEARGEASAFGSIPSGVVFLPVDADRAARTQEACAGEWKSAAVARWWTALRAQPRRPGINQVVGVVDAENRAAGQDPWGAEGRRV
jgi:hypothetical protein